MKSMIAFALLLMMAQAARADLVTTINLWPNLPPGEGPATQPEAWNARSMMLSNVSTPTIAVYRPEPSVDTGAAILVCPGGGFTALAMDHEGRAVVPWLNTLGVTAVLLKYRVPNHGDAPRYLAALQDAERAMCLIRANAGEWGIDPHRVGIIGFSAGGRVVADITTNLNKPVYDPIDSSDKESFVPNFALAIYPGGVVVKDDKGEMDQLAPDVKPTAQTPPTFIVIATDDRNGSENAVYYYLALKKAGVNTEMHIYSEGGHGFGMRPSPAPHATWIDRAEDWMKYHKFILKPTTRPS